MKQKYPESLSRDLEKEPDASSLRNAVRMLKSNPVVALSKLESLAQRGSVLSMLYIGDAYANGRGVKRDIERGDEWYRRAADHGSLEAGFRLALADWHARKYEQALHKFLALSERGYTPAMCCIGSIYNSGIGAQKNHVQAYKFWNMADNNGHLIARQGLSHLLRSGKFGLLGVFRGYVKLINLLFIGTWYKITFPESERFRCW